MLMHFKRTFRTTVRASKEYTNLLFLKKIEPLLNTKRRRPKKDAHKNKKLNFKKKEFCKITNTILLIWMHQQTTFLFKEAQM